MMIRKVLMSTSVLLSIGGPVASSTDGPAQMTVVFNNVPFDQSLTTCWGLSCFIRYKDKGILFDTGGDGEVLLSNMGKLARNIL